jgi:hypothetical protein
MTENIRVLFQHSPGGTEKATQSAIQSNWFESEFGSGAYQYKPHWSMLGHSNGTAVFS